MRSAPLLDRIQRETLRYFTDFAHPASGMARERYGAPDWLETVTTGGTGFGVMALIVGAERGFAPREAVLAQLDRIVAHLEASPRYKGAFPHWMHGTTGATIAFSAHDDGGDIVETAFLMMGLLTARQWLAPFAPALAARIQALWWAVDWAGFCPVPERLHWHWSPTHGFGKLPLMGWHEGLIAFVLGAASPTHPISPAAYQIGWKESPGFRNGQSYHQIALPLGPAEGGPLFFSHYSFLGLDPRGLIEDGIDYFAQNRAQARINQAHCVENPGGFAGYGPASWGLTACDGPRGYNAFSPTNDHGVIAPTAALASLPYLPRAALAAAAHFAAHKDGALWGPYGFYDAFDDSRGWIAPSHLAIDQGPIVAMIENARTGLLWRLFMSAPEVRKGLMRLGFSSPHLG